MPCMSLFLMASHCVGAPFPDTPCAFAGAGGAATLPTGGGTSDIGEELDMADSLGSQRESPPGRRLGRVPAREYGQDGSQRSGGHSDGERGGAAAAAAQRNALGAGRRFEAMASAQARVPMSMPPAATSEGAPVARQAPTVQLWTAVATGCSRWHPSRQARGFYTLEDI
eukprot:366301-Chlamydomonas_euryale.AAC.1